MTSEEWFLELDALLAPVGSRKAQLFADEEVTVAGFVVVKEPAQLLGRGQRTRKGIAQAGG